MFSSHILTWTVMLGTVSALWLMLPLLLHAARGDAVWSQSSSHPKKSVSLLGVWLVYLEHWRYSHISLRMHDLTTDTKSSLARGLLASRMRSAAAYLCDWMRRTTSFVKPAYLATCQALNDDLIFFYPTCTSIHVIEIYRLL